MYRERGNVSSGFVTKQWAWGASTNLGCSPLPDGAPAVGLIGVR